MIRYFGYGSNMNLTSLAAKGVVPLASQTARLANYTLAFNVHHWFRHEGGVGNILPTSGAEVLGVVHTLDDQHLALLDAVESYGTGYDRIEVELSTADGPVKALTYVGIDSYLDDRCLPTQRYLNILVSGAKSAGIDPDYVERLAAHPIHQPDEYGPFAAPDGAWPEFTTDDLPPKFTALAGHVFDMSDCRWQHECLHSLFGGKDMTLFHLKRMDRTDGARSLTEVIADRMTDAQRAYLRAYLHEYAREYRYAGTVRYEESR